MKNLLYLDLTTTSNPKLSYIGYTERSNIKPILFRKFFPKYLRYLSFPAKEGSTKSKLKRTKVIRDFTAFPLAQRRDWRLIIANKIKSVKILSSQPQFKSQFVGKVKLFPFLKSVHIDTPTDARQFKKAGPYQVKACKKMARLKHLENLELSRLLSCSKKVIQQLETSPRLLRQLKNLRISCEWKGGEDAEMMRIIKGSKNLLRYMTSLRLATLNSTSHYKDFKVLADSCPNLQTLSFEFCCREITYSPRVVDKYSEKSFPVEVNYLSALETFHNLRSLDLRIADTFTFLNDLALPPRIEHLLLNFEECLSNEIMDRIQQKDSQPFDENKILVKFYENFKHLHKLQALKMYFSSDIDPQQYERQNYLSQGILKRIPSLQKLTFISARRCRGLNQGYRSSVDDLYLPQFFQSFHHLNETLETLEIGDQKVVFASFDLSSSKSRFVKLSTLKFTGILNTKIPLFLEQVISLGDSITTIELNTFMDNTIQSLVSLLQQLKKLYRPETLKLVLQIKFFEDKSFEDLGLGFEDVMKELQEEEDPRLQGVSLSLFTSTISPGTREFLEAYGKKFENFNILPSYADFLSD